MSQYIEFKDFMFVEVPQGAYDFELNTNWTGTFIDYMKSQYHLGIGDVYIPPGNWQIVAVSDEVYASNSKNIIPLGGYLYNGTVESFRDYTGEYYEFSSAYRSYISLLSAAGVKYDRFLILKKSK